MSLKSKKQPITIGIDYAGYGVSRTVVFTRRGKAVTTTILSRELDVAETANRIREIFGKLGAEKVFLIKPNGAAAALLDILILKLGRKVCVTSPDFSEFYKGLKTVFDKNQIAIPGDF